MQQEQPFANTHQMAEPVRAASYEEPAMDNAARGPSMTAHEPIIPQSMGAKEAKSLHKTLEKEAKAEDQHIKSQIKDIEKAEKAERKAEKADSKALKGETKAQEHVHSANKELERAQAKHDQALREAQKAHNEVEIKKQHHAQVTQNLHGAKAQLENLTETRKETVPVRNEKIKELDQILSSSK